MNLIWDLDGTLIDSYDIMTHNIYNVFRGYTHVKKAQIKQEIINTSVTAYFMRMARAWQLPLDDLYHHYRLLTDGVQAGDYPLMEAVRGVLEALSDLGAKHYIYTHRGASTARILEAHDLDAYFVELVTSDNKFKRKPDPEGLVYLIKRHHLDPNATFYIGDRTLDVACGKAAGVKTVYFNPDGLILDDATYNIRHLREMVDLMEVLWKKY